MLSKQEYGAILKPHGGFLFAQFHFAQDALLTAVGAANVVASAKTVLWLSPERGSNKQIFGYCESAGF